MAIGIDRRIFERREGKLAVRYSPQGSNQEFCSTTKNISGGGVRIKILKKLSPGTLLDLEIFKYNTDLKTRCRGRIVWIWDEPVSKDDEQGFEAGIQFIDQKELSIGRLFSLLESQNRYYEEL